MRNKEKRYNFQTFFHQNQMTKYLDFAEKFHKKMFSKFFFLYFGEKHTKKIIFFLSNW